MPDLDKTDQRILDLMKRDSRIPNSELAEQVGLSPSTCWRRVKALENAGVIRHYTVALDDARQGLGFGAIVHVRLTRHDPDQLAAFLRVVQNRQEIRACHATTGQADYHLHVVCADIEAYNVFLDQVLFRIPAVASAQTNVILRTIKV